MGYFASLLRQTGIRTGSIASPPAASVNGLEVSETRPVEPARAPITDSAAPETRRAPDRQPAPTPAPEGPLRLAPAPPPSTWVAPTPPGQPIPPPEARPATSGPEVILETAFLSPPEVPTPTEVPAGFPVARPDPTPIAVVAQASPQMAATPSLAESASGSVEQGKQTPEAPQPTGRPTLAEVRAWVAQPILGTAEPRRPESPAAPPWTAVSTMPPVHDDSGHPEAFTLEIGTIQIVVDGPTTQEAPRPAAAARPAPPQRPETERASRHYLRL